MKDRKTSESTEPAVDAQEIHRGVTFGFFAQNGYYASEKARLEVDRRGDQGLTVWNKPAGAIMKKWYARPERRGE